MITGTGSDSKTAEQTLESIGKDGYVLIKQATRPEAIKELLAYVENFECSDDQQASIDANLRRLNGYDSTIYNVAAKKPKVLRLFTRGSAGELLKRMLNNKYYYPLDPSLPNYALRAAHFGSSCEAIPYHIDSFIPYGGDYSSVSRMLFLNRSTRHNGCTLVAPWSHKLAAYAPQGLNSQSVPIEAEPGDMVVIDSRIGHETLANETKTKRWALSAAFCRWHIKQSYDYPRVRSQSVFDSPDEDEKVVFGYCSFVPLDEFEKTELKTGLDKAKPRR